MLSNDGIIYKGPEVRDLHNCDIVEFNQHLISNDDRMIAKLDRYLILYTQIYKVQTFDISSSGAISI